MEENSPQKHVKYGGTTWHKDDPKEQVYHLINNGAKVLDVGCSTGALGKRLRAEKRCIVHGVEIDRDAAAYAVESLDAVYNENLDEIEKWLHPSGLSRHKFDYITITDCLEHCVRPQQILSALKELLTTSGQIIVSLPNVANYKIRSNLLMGRFNYEKYGIMDETHLRFYTLETSKDLVARAGYRVIDVLHTTGVKKRWRWLPRTLIATQFIVIARP